MASHAVQKTEPIPVRALSKETPVTIGVVVLVLAGVVWLLNTQWDTQTVIKGIERDVLELRKDLLRAERSMGENWAKHDMKAWAQLLAAKNKDIEVPDIP